MTQKYRSNYARPACDAVTLQQKFNGKRDVECADKVYTFVRNQSVLNCKHKKKKRTRMTSFVNLTTFDGEKYEDLTDNFTPCIHQGAPPKFWSCKLILIAQDFKCVLDATFFRKIFFLFSSVNHLMK